MFEIVNEIHWRNIALFNYFKLADLYSLLYCFSLVIYSYTSSYRLIICKRKERSWRSKVFAVVNEISNSETKLEN